MALSDGEVDRIKAELGYNILALGAEPYFQHRKVFDVIQANVSGSTTPATVATTAIAGAGVATITLASVSGLSAGTRVQLDTEAQRETVTVIAVSGSAITVRAAKPHGSAYLVEIESAQTIVRGLLADLASLEQVYSLDAFNSLGLKQVDEVIWQDGKSRFALVESARDALRDRLSRAVGFPRYDSGGSSLEVY